MVASAVPTCRGVGAAPEDTTLIVRLVGWVLHDPDHHRAGSGRSRLAPYSATPASVGESGSRAAPVPHLAAALDLQRHERIRRKGRGVEPRAETPVRQCHERARRTPDRLGLVRPHPQRRAAAQPSHHLEPVDDDHIDLARAWLQLQAELVRDALDEGRE